MKRADVWQIKMTKTEADAILVSMLTGMDLEPNLAASRETVSQLVERARYHGVLQLIFAQLREARIPEDIAEELRHEQVSEIFWEDRHQELLKSIVEAFATKGIEPIIFKGTALAYSHYREPWLRTRGDTDILVSEQDYAEAAKVLESIGLVRAAAVSGEFISYQESFQSVGEMWREHCIDLHRKINNSELISQLLRYEELKALARPLEALGRGARAPSPIHALEIACIHRGVHLTVPYYFDGVAQFGGGRLIWLYDIHLLASKFQAAEWRELAEHARIKKFGGPCRDGLSDAQSLFKTTLPEGLQDELNSSVGPLSSYLKSGPRNKILIDLWSLPDLKSRSTYFRELLFPPASYMQDKYNETSFRWLPWLYFRRIVEGFRRRISSD